MHGGNLKLTVVILETERINKRGIKERRKASRKEEKNI
jgi:hypothetical protein